MKIITTKLTSVLFLLLGLMPMVLVLFFEIQKQQNRRSMREDLESAGLQTIIIPEDEVVWMDDHEVKINGVMFDIQTSKLENRKYTFTGLFDINETELIEAEEAMRENTKEDDQLSSLINLLQSPFRTMIGDIVFSGEGTTVFHPARPFFLNNLLRKVETPPPRSSTYIYA